MYPVLGKEWPSELFGLMHDCSGDTECKFCAWRKRNPIDSDGDWERLFEDSQLKMGTPDDDCCEFPVLDEEFEKILTQTDICFSNTTRGKEGDPSCSYSKVNRVYASPKGSKEIQVAIKSRIPKKTQSQTSWCVRVWSDWALARNTRLLQDERPFDFDFVKLSVKEMNFWLCRFVLEVRKKNGDPYPPDSLYQLCCGLQRQLRESGRADVNLFEDPQLYEFRSTLDSEMKRLNSTGNFLDKRQAQPISPEQEDLLWEVGILGDHSPQALLNTMIWQCGLYFALRSGNEHRKLRHSPSQIQVFEPPAGRAHLTYKEDVSKTNQGGLESRHKKRKEVVHYANAENPKRCFVRLYKLYNSKCPSNRPANAFYLQPLSKPKQDIWYARVAMGHNSLSTTVSRLMNEGGFEGYYTNHSLRVSAATRLFNSGVDEQLIMARTGHSSTDGVRVYKRASEKLKELTSDVLNGTTQEGMEPMAKKMTLEPIAQNEQKLDENGVPFANRQPVFQISGGTNITINISYNVNFQFCCYMDTVHAIQLLWLFCTNYT